MRRGKKATYSANLGRWPISPMEGACSGKVINVLEEDVYGRLGIAVWKEKKRKEKKKEQKINQSVTKEDLKRNRRREKAPYRPMENPQ